MSIDKLNENATRTKMIKFLNFKSKCEVVLAVGKKIARKIVEISSFEFWSFRKLLKLKSLEA